MQYLTSRNERGDTKDVSRFSKCTPIKARIIKSSTQLQQLSRTKVVSRLIRNATKGLNDAKRLVTLGRCDEAQAALDFAEGKLKSAYGVSLLVDPKGKSRGR